MMAAGRISELFGEKGLNMDKFALTVGYRKAAQETWDNPGALEEDHRQILAAYADGVNDYLNGIGWGNEDSTAYTLPPEFHVLGITNIEPWTPIDSLSLMRLINFHLSYNWSQDLLRDIYGSLEGGELKDLVEELVPFNLDNSYNLKSVLDDADMKQAGLYSEIGLMERYKSS